MPDYRRQSSQAAGRMDGTTGNLRPEDRPRFDKRAQKKYNTTMAARTRKIKLDETWKAKERVSMLANRLADHALGKIELSNTQVRSIEIVLDKTVPSLTAVEQTVIDARDAMTEDQILLEARALVSEHPALLDTLIALRDAERETVERPRELEMAAGANPAQPASASKPAPGAGLPTLNLLISKDIVQREAAEKVNPVHPFASDTTAITGAQGKASAGQSRASAWANRYRRADKHSFPRAAPTADPPSGA